MNAPASGSFAALEALAAQARCVGLALRGAFHARAREFEPLLGAVPAGTVVLLGFTGSEQWPHFAASAEACDGLAHPLDRWSRRVIDALAREHSALAVYPGDTPVAPFQQWAMRCESVSPSPLGLLIHPQYGLWHAYRGALVLPQVLALPPVLPVASPCASCRERPCLNACPVEAFGTGGFRLERCVAHLTREKGGRCLGHGCLARQACPAGATYRYVPAQMRFHMQAFHRAVAR